MQTKECQYQHQFWYLSIFLLWYCYSIMSENIINFLFCTVIYMFYVNLTIQLSQHKIHLYKQFEAIYRSNLTTGHFNIYKKDNYVTHYGIAVSNTNCKTYRYIGNATANMWTVCIECELQQYTCELWQYTSNYTAVNCSNIPATVYTWMRHCVCSCIHMNWCNISVTVSSHLISVP